MWHRFIYYFDKFDNLHFTQQMNQCISQKMTNAHVSRIYFLEKVRIIMVVYEKLYPFRINWHLCRSQWTRFFEIILKSVFISTFWTVHDIILWHCLSHYYKGTKFTCSFVMRRASSSSTPDCCFQCTAIMWTWLINFSQLLCCTCFFVH